MENEEKKHIEERSRTLAFLLRHDKTYDFLEHGYRDVDDLVANHGFTKEELSEIVATDDKGRFEFFDEQQLLVRARYGHSVKVDVELPEAVPPAVLYHGTAKRFVESIRQQGILKMSRLYVHLSATVDEAIKVGKRHGEPVVLEINARRMSEDGIRFLVSRNGVWMTEFVDAKYINGSQFAGTNTHHCVGFDLPTVQEAFEHFRGQLTVLKDYGDMCNGHCLHTWDDGKRLLCQCSECGGLVLVQQSECHIFDYDDYYTDYFPVDSPEEAEQLNEKYGGFAIEMEWEGKKIFYTNGNVTGKW